MIPNKIIWIVNEAATTSQAHPPSTSCLNQFLSWNCTIAIAIRSKTHEREYSKNSYEEYESLKGPWKKKKMNEAKMIINDLTFCFSSYTSPPCQFVLALLFFTWLNKGWVISVNHFRFLCNCSWCDGTQAKSNSWNAKQNIQSWSWSYWTFSKIRS